MSIKDSELRLRTSPDIILTPRESASSQSLLTIINKPNFLRDNPYGTSPNLKFVDSPGSPQRQWTSPSKNTSNQKSPIFFRHSEYKIAQKSPRTARVSQVQTEQNRLSFKKSFKSIARNNNSINQNNANNNSLEKHQRMGEGRQKESLQEELIISLKEIKRLRDVIDALVRDNHKLKRIAHSILDGKFEDPVNTSIGEYHKSYDDPSDKHPSNSSSQVFYNILNSSLLSSSPHSPTSSLSPIPTITPLSPGRSEGIQSLRLQNTRLSQQVTKLKEQLEHKQSRINGLQSSLSQCQQANQQIQEQTLNMKMECIHSRNRVFELQQKIIKLQKTNLKLQHLRGEIMAESRDIIQMDQSDQYSIVQEKITNNYQDHQFNRLQYLLKDQDPIPQVPSLQPSLSTNILPVLRMERVGSTQHLKQWREKQVELEMERQKGREKEKQREREKDSDSIRTKESQSVIQSSIIAAPLRKEMEYQRVGELMRVGSNKE